LGTYVAGVVPGTDYRFGWIVFISQGAEAGSFKKEIPGGLRFKTEPAGGQKTQEVAAGEQQNGAGNGADTPYDAVRARRDFVE
jgi:hypothetical protein